MSVVNRLYRRQRIELQAVARADLDRKDRKSERLRALLANWLLRHGAAGGMAHAKSVHERLSPGHRLEAQANWRFRWLVGVRGGWRIGSTSVGH
jgi:hypothetical protein